MIVSAHAQPRGPSPTSPPSYRTTVRGPSQQGRATDKLLLLRTTLARESKVPGRGPTREPPAGHRSPKLENFVTARGPTDRRPPDSRRSSGPLGSPARHAITPPHALDRRGDVLLEVEYIGPHTGTVDFVACLCLEEDTPEANNSAPAPLSFRAEAPCAPQHKYIRLTLPARAHDLHDTSITLCVANPEHWIVHDISISGDTLLVEAGDLPGELFTNHPGRIPLHLGRLRAKEELVIEALYMGPLTSASLAYEVSGYELPTQANEPVSAFLAMSCGVPIKGTVQIQGNVSVPEGYAFLPEEIVLRDPHKRHGLDVRNGQKSQFAARDQFPGDLFGEGVQRYQPRFDPISRDNPLTMFFTYAGGDPQGEPLFCGIVGRLVSLPFPATALATAPRSSAEL